MKFSQGLKVKNILVVLILFIGAFCRLYRIEEYMTFLGDEGRDALVVKRMILDHKFTLLGPITSVGSMYMGPIYYYLMVPFLWFWNFNPVGPAIMVAFFGVGTVFLLYILGTKFFHYSVGLIASFFYAISPLPIIYGRSSWNPNVVPFFATLLIFSLLETFVFKKYFFIILAFFCLGILIQLHYVTSMFFLIIIAIYFFLKPKLPRIYYFFSFVAFLAAYFPFLLFELRHNFVNTHQLIKFIFTTQTSVDLISFLFNFWQTVSDVSVRIFWRLIVIENAELTKIFLGLVFFSLYFYYREKIKEETVLISLKIILIWLFFGVISFGFYRGVIYDYYFGSLFTVPFILVGIVIFQISRFPKGGRFLASVLFSLLTYFHLHHSPLKIEPNNMLKNTQKIARFVLEKSEGKPYNFALLAPFNSDHAYRYFLEIWGYPPITIKPPQSDPERSTVAERLIVVCEEKVCQPLGHPLWEIAGFGRAEIEGEWSVSTVKVFSLVHYKEKRYNK